MNGVAVLARAGDGPWQLARALADRGLPTAVVVADGERPLNGYPPSVACTYASSEAVADALGAAAELVGPLRAVVDAVVAPGSVDVGPLTEMDEARWAAVGEEPLTEALRCLQGAHQVLGSGGRYVVLVPTLSMSGAPGLVPWASVSEGRRALVKVAARVWGAEGVTVNCLAVPATLLAEPPAQGSFDRPGLPTPALTPPPTAAEVAGVVAALLGDDLAPVTGATVAVDGGVWMTP